MADEDLRIRIAGASDVPGIHRIFVLTYGEDYPYADFFDEDWLTRSVYRDDILMLVAEDRASGMILGTASVVFDIGAQSDLIGEFGRLAVRPEARGRGVGKRLMAARIEHTRDRLHVAIVENRTPHPFSQRISEDFGFAPVGFLALKHRFQARESVALYVRHFEPALRLRRNNPRVVPEAQALAHRALEACGLAPDLIVDESSPAYPCCRDFEQRDLTAEGLPALMRIERGRVRKREVFGPMRLHYGFFKLHAKHATYLLALAPSADASEPAVAGAVGYIHDELERTLRIFELIAADEEAIRFVLERLLARAAEDWGVEYAEIDVSAHAPRMQRTLVELGFLPVAYVPAMVFHRVERRDVIKMARLLVPPTLTEMRLTPAAERVATLVMRGLERQAVLPELASALPRLELFAGLSQEQARRLASICRVACFDDGQPLFGAGEPAEEMFLLIEGAVDVSRDGATRPVGRVGAGESLAEGALLGGQPHSVSAAARGAVTAAVLSREAFSALARRRPDIGMPVYRNLALGLGHKLRSMDARVAEADGAS